MRRRNRRRGLLSYRKPELKCLGALLVLAVAFPASAQVTNVSATIVDPNGIPYANGRVKAQLVLAGAGVTGQPTVTVSNTQQCISAGKGSAPCQIEFPGTVGPFPLDATGSFTVALQDDVLVTPVGTTWLFSVSNPGADPPVGFGPVSFSLALTITGASQSISSQLNAVAPLLLRGTGGSSLLANNNIWTGINQFNEVINCGPDPWVDVRCYHVRGVDPNITPAAVGLTANITSGLAVATISSASTFVNNDGVVIYGAGPPCSLTTPGAPTVTPSVSQVLTGTGMVATAADGATTYNYQIVARSKNGCLTAASSVGTSAVGRSSLGSQSVAITSASRSNDVVTVVTSSAHGLVVGAMVYITQILDGSFGGWYRVDTTPDNTHFTFSSGQDTRSGASTATTGGTAFWFNVNHLTWTAVSGAWEYYIYGRTVGSLTLRGVSRPQGATITDLTWDDFGSPMMDGIVLPPFVPSTPPGSATSNHLVTTIVSGAGTTSLTLAATAGTTVSGATIRFDATPNILTAANAVLSAGGSLYFPAGLTFVVNSYLALPKVGVVQEGGLFLNETMEIGGGGSVWQGNLLPQPGATSFSFDFGAGAPVIVNSANPGIFVEVNNQNSAVYSGLRISGVTNGALLWVSDKGSQITWKDMGFSTASGNADYMGVGLFIRGQTTDGPHDVLLDRVVFVGGPAQVNGVSATPLLFCLYCGTARLESLNLSRRGVLWIPGASGGDLQINGGREQGGIMPMLTLTSQPTSGVGGIFQVDNYELDTMAHALVAILPQGSGSTSFNLGINGGIPTPSADSVSRPGMITGRRFNYVSTNLVDFSGQNRDVHLEIGGTAIDGVFSTGIGTASLYSLVRPGSSFATAPSYQFFTDQVPLPAPTCPVSAGGNVTIGTAQWQVVPVWQNGAEGTPSQPCTATTTSGNQTVTLTWTAAAGSPLGYNVRLFNNLTWPKGANDCSTFPQYTGLTAVLIAGFGCASVASLPAGGPSVMNSSGVFTPTLGLGSTLFANLGTPRNGTFIFCSDCTIANPCAGGGTGAFAKRLNGVWVCN